jgi:competence protein ComGC
MTDIDQYRLNRIDELIEENDKLRAKVKDTNEIDIGKLLRARIEEYELKVGRLRRNISKLINHERISNK